MIVGHGGKEAGGGLTSSSTNLPGLRRYEEEEIF